MHPFDWPDCSEGRHGAARAARRCSPPPGVAALDWRHQRRRLAAATPGHPGGSRVNSVTPRCTCGVARSYGPLLAVAMAFLLMAVVVPTAGRAHEAYAGNVEVPGLHRGRRPPTRSAGRHRRQRPPTARTGGTEAARRAPTAGGGRQGGVQPCTDRTLQVPGDPYSPPCYAFSGGNGGTTYQGVTDKEIIVTVRTLEGPSAAEIFADISGRAGERLARGVPQHRQRARRVLLDAVPDVRPQDQARRVPRRGQRRHELLGGGKEKALADAVRASKELGAFADISAITIPYADALAQQKVVNIGSPYPSREWFVSRRPYSWSLFPDGTNVVESSAAALPRAGCHRARTPTTPAPRSRARRACSASSRRRTRSTRSR